MNENAQAKELAVGAGAVVVPLPFVEGARPRRLPAEEQLAYARLLDAGMKLGLALLVITFAVYVLGLMTPHVPVDDLPRYWGLPVRKYLAATGIATGWGWIRMLDRGDLVNFVGIAFLSGVTIVCYLAISPIFFRKRDWIYAGLSLLEVLVLTLAASGLLGAGAH